MQAQLLPRWDDVRVFLALYRARSLAAASERLGLDASTASRRLVALEEVLGARLFDRTREGLSPTSSAEQLLVPAEEAERGMMKLAETASGLETRVEGNVRITAPPGMVEVFLAPLMIELHRLHPLLVVELDASQQVLDLSRREADIALRTIRPQGAELIMTKLATTTYVPLASPGYAKELAKDKGKGKGKKSTTPPRWIGWSEAYARIPPAAWIARHVDARHIVLVTSSLGAQLAAAATGLGVVLAPDGIAAQSELVAAPLPKTLARGEPWPTEDVWLVGHRALRGVPRVAAVWEFIRAQADRFVPRRDRTE